jgi:hypothetical protein
LWDAEREPPSAEHNHHPPTANHQARPARPARQVLEELFGANWASHKRPIRKLPTRVVLEVGGYPGGPPAGQQQEQPPQSDEVGFITWIGG